MPRSRVPSFYTPRAFGDSVRPSISASAARVAARAAPVARTLPAATAIPAAPAPVAAPVPAAYVPAPAAPVYAPPAPAPVAISPEMAPARAIMNHPEAVGRADMAKHLALETDISAAEAVARLAAAARGPSSVVASGMAGAAIAREALGLAPDAAADMAVAQGVAVMLGGSLGTDAAAAAQWLRDMDEGARTARELLGR